MGADIIPEQRKILFAEVPEDKWESIMHGFGKSLSGIFSDAQYRPTSKDPEFSSMEDKAELDALIKAIYSRI